MNIPNLDIWIKYMANHPLVLIGFGIMLFAGVVLVINRKGKKSKTIQKYVFYIFVLVAGTEVIGAIFMIICAPQKSITVQQSSGANSANIEGAKNVGIRFGSESISSSEAKTPKNNADSILQSSNVSKKANKIQNSSGIQSPNISGSDTVRISY